MICWACGKEITSENSSKEHIIPNALFGKLKPRKLLCRKCNSNFDSIDRSLADDLESISILVNSKRDNGSPKILKGKTSSGEIFKIHPTGKAEIETSVKKVGNKYQIKVSNEEELEKIKEGIQKKHKIINSSRKDVEDYLGPLKLENSNILSDKTFRAVTKIAIDYYIYEGGSREDILDVINLVKTENDPKGIVWCYFGEEISISKSACEILHSIILVGDKDQGILYCYIELYGALNFIVLLSNEYIGDNLKKTYFLDVEKGEPVNKEVTISLNKEKIEEILKNQDLDTENIITHKMKVGNTLQSKRIHEHVMDLILKTIDDYPTLEFRDIWEKVKVNFDEYPHLNGLAFCPYHVKVYSHNGPICACNSNEYTYILTSITIKGGYLFLQLKTICNTCRNTQNYEYIQSLD